MSKQPPPAPTASTVGPCPTIIQIVGRPGTGSFPKTIAPPDHPSLIKGKCLFILSPLGFCRKHCLVERNNILLNQTCLVRNEM